MVHSFLLIGQSNMAGRGLLADAEPIDTNGDKIFVLRNGRWQVIFRPVNPDRRFSGTCLAESFAKAYSDDHPEVNVGLIPCADGGTKLDQWCEGSVLFDNAVACARLAMRSSRLTGILWHQGESDCDDALYPLYLEKITAIMRALRRELGAEDIPLIVGGLGDYLANCKVLPGLAKNYLRVNEALMRFAAETPYTAFASAEGLTSNPELLHFNHSSLLEFGRRYYAAFKTVAGAARVPDGASREEDTHRTEIEKL